MARALGLVPSAVVAFALVALLLTGCGGEVEPPALTPEAGAPAPVGSDPSKLGTGYRYRFDMIAPSNDNFAITERELYLWFWPDTARVSFRLENRLGTPVRIFWDECRFTTTEGTTYKCIHEGITYERRYDPQDYTLVPSLGRYRNWIAPLDLLDDPRAATGGGMRLLFPTDVSALAFIGKTFTVDLVMEVENRRKSYRLVFKVDSVIPPG